jgi:hypothetical protein
MRPRRSTVAFLVLLAPVVFVGGAPAPAVSDSGPPRPINDAGSRGKPAGAVRPEAAQLVTGSPEHLQSVVAGFPLTAVMKVVPVAAKVGSYPTGTTIVGNELKAFAGGFRAWFEFKLSHWDPNGDDVPPLWLWQFKIDGSGCLGANADPSNPGVDLTAPVIVCPNNAPCVTAFGETWATCDLIVGTCKPAYVDLLGTGRADSWCADTGSGPCQTSDCNTISLSFACFAIYPSGVLRPDVGIEYYGATAVLDIPAGAQGKYTVNLNSNETFMADTGSPPTMIPILSETGFVVNIVPSTVQACCHNAGGCTDIDAAECANAGGAPQGQGTDCLHTQCPAPTGSCCNQSTSTCTDDVLQANCSTPLEWTAGTLCVNLPNPCLITGACCDSSPGAGGPGSEGACTDDLLEVDCTGLNKVWTRDATCAEVTCLEVVGACCDRSPGAGGTCANGRLQAQCTGSQQVWTQGAACANILCEEARGSCCNTTTFACTDSLLQADCQGAGLAWRIDRTCASCVAGPEMLVTPVPAKVGSYPPGTSIVGQEINLPAGGVRIWCDVQVRNWDPDGNGVPPLWLWQIAVDGNGLLGVNADPPNPGADISLPVVPCANNAACVSAFGESWAKCDVGAATCKAGYVDTTGAGRPDSWCRDTGSGPCNVADVDLFPPIYRFFSIYAPGAARPDGGITYYAGTLVLDVPAGAAGRYTIPLVLDETFMADTGSPSNDIPTSAETGFVVVIRPLGVVPDATGETNRSISFAVPAPAVATGSAGQTAIRVTMLDLQNPNPPNAPCCPPPNFSAYESATCNAAGEMNGCARWVGKPGTVLEVQGAPGLGNFKGARLQCTPYYHDFGSEGLIHVVGGEILPSSRYEVEVLAASCKGNEGPCAAVSNPVVMTTRRSGDIAANYNPPPTSTQPDAIDVTQLVNKLKNVIGAPSRSIAQIQPNVPELNADINALDIVAVVDAVKGLAYSFGGPCPCPSLVSCGNLPCPGGAGTCVGSAFPGLGPGAMCVKTCSGSGDPCINNAHCPTGQTCGTPLCRDRCGRCTPP